MKWYHEKKEKTKRKYLQGYYPKHFRTPNLIVCWLYEVGYFLGDFVPLLLNLIEGIYSTIKKLIGFVVGLLVDSMIFIVLAGSVVFSVFHSIQRLRIAGATNGLEYVGVLMFEVIFMSSSAMLTGFLMKKKLPKSFLEWFGLILTSLGFLVGLVFVWWSNVNGMAPTTEGFIIGSAVPFLVLIGQGIIAYRYFIENQETVDNDTKNSEETNHKPVVHDTKNKFKNDTEIDDEMVPETSEKMVAENGKEANYNIVEKTVEEIDAKVDIDIVKNSDEISTENNAEFGAEMNANDDEKADENEVHTDAKKSTKPDTQADEKTGAETDAEAGAEAGAETDAETGAETDAETDAKTDAETGAKTDAETDAETGTEAGAETGAEADAETGAKTGTEADAETDAETGTEAGAETGAEADAETGAKTGTEADAKTDAETDAETGTEAGAETGAEADAETGAKTGTEADAEPATKAKKSDSKKSSKKGSSKKSSSVKVPAKVKRWAKKFQAEKGKLPGRVEIEKKFGYGKSMCSNYAAKLKEELGEKAS